MKILVTGGAGFIGSHLCRRLVKKGEQVVAIDNFNNFYNPRFKWQNIADLQKMSDFKLYQVDILEYGKLEKIFKKEKPETIVHLAARAGVRPSIKFPKLYSRVNILGTLNLLELSKKYKVENFIFASSSSVYGERTKVPFSENDSADNPISPYAATKRAGELLCYNYHHLYGLNCTCLRFFTVYGPAGRPDMAPHLFTEAILEGKLIKMFGDGSSRRDYTYIDDIVSGILSAVKKKSPFEIINLGNSKTVSLKYFIHLIEILTGKKARIEKLSSQPGDVPLTKADISKAKKLLGYCPKIKIETGMKKFIDWYKKNRLKIS